MAADFVAGLIHWAEGAYFTEDTPFMGQWIIKPIIVHHHFPQLSWWESSKLLGLIGATHRSPACDLRKPIHPNFRTLVGRARRARLSTFGVELRH